MATSPLTQLLDDPRFSHTDGVALPTYTYRTGDVTVTYTVGDACTHPDTAWVHLVSATTGRFYEHTDSLDGAATLALRYADLMDRVHPTVTVQS